MQTCHSGLAKNQYKWQENQYFRDKICMTEENIMKTLSHSWKKFVFWQILRKKICILPNSKGEKSVYTDKISMSGRSADGWFLHGGHVITRLLINRKLIYCVLRQQFVYSLRVLSLPPLVWTPLRCTLMKVTKINHKNWTLYLNWLRKVQCPNKCSQTPILHLLCLNVVGIFVNDFEHYSGWGFKVKLFFFQVLPPPNEHTLQKSCCDFLIYVKAI